jgi:taurine dioxygenase
MKTRIHNNGWTIFIDEDINTLTKQEILEVGRLTTTNMVVVFKNQQLTDRQEINFCKTIGNCQYVVNPFLPKDGQRFAPIAVNEHILRVTGEKNDKGEPGLFGHVDALDWHANQCSNKDRNPLIWLYGVRGTAESRTSWLNNIESYKDLDEDFKALLKTKKIYCGFETGRYTPSTVFKEHIHNDVLFDLVMTNQAGQTGLYFPFLQTFGMADTSEEEYQYIWNKLKNHVLQEKYMYHHDWNDGDVVISEQWLSIHKRWKFDQMEKRLLHRIAFDYNKIYK